MNKRHLFVAMGLVPVFGIFLAGHLLEARQVASEGHAPPPRLAVVAAEPGAPLYADTLRSGETLSELLGRARLAAHDVRVLLEELGPHQDPRRIRPGFVVSYRQSLADGETRQMDVRLDADRTLSLRRNGSGWLTSMEEVEVHTDTVVLAGDVRSSLYAALMRDEQGVDVPAGERARIADALAEEVFAWQVDFARDQRAGDEFRVLYERTVRPDGSARSGRVLAAEMRVAGRDYEGFHFAADDGTEDYFDRSGESLRRAFLRAPLNYRRVSSVYTDNRLHPVTGRNRPHHGIDYAAPTGTPVRAAGDGRITHAGRRGGYGIMIDIRHTRGYLTRYAHLNGLAKGMRRGSQVRQGDVIGYVGMTGMATGPHLHYEFHVNGRPLDPSVAVPNITGEPLPDEHRTAFEGMVRRQVAVLDRQAEPVLLAATALGD